MNDFSFKTSKGEILKSMLKNPQTSKLIKEAMSSGMGSTSRAKAKKIFSIMSKLHASKDGMGGPGMMYEQMAASPQPEPMQVGNERSKSMVVFNKIPKPRITYGKKVANVMDGSGGPGTNPFGTSNPYNLAGTSSMTPNMSTAQGPAYRDPTTGQITYINQSAPVQPKANPLVSGNPYGSTPPSTVNTQKTIPSVTPPAPRPQLSPIDQRVSQLRNIFAPGGVDPYGQTNSTIREYLVKDGYDRQDIINAVGSGEDVFDKIGGKFSSLLSGITGQKQQAPSSHPGYDIYGRPYASSAPQKTITQQNTNQTGSETQTQILGEQQQGSQTGGSQTTGGGNAANNVASFLGVSATTPLSSIKITDLMKAIARNEGYTSGASKIAINNNNPGNLKFIGQAGATQGQAASDGGYYAKFATTEAGWAALQADLQAKYNGGKYNTLADLMNVYSPDSGGGSTPGSPVSKYSGLSKTAEEASGQDMGAGMFAYNQLMDPNNPITHGKTLEQMQVDNEKSLWDKYNIGTLRDEETRMREEGAALPKNVTAYITARDSYLVDTDKKISDFIASSVNNTDMSNPANAAKANAQLNYLYTLRGRQNQSYIGYLNDAKTQHQADVDHVANLYSTALNSYEKELNGDNAILQGQYNMYAAALSDMYTAVDGAPLKALQLQAYTNQINDAHAQAIADALKSGAQTSYLEDYTKLKGHIIDSNGMAMPGTDLVKQLQDLSVLSPEISSTSVINAYVEGVTHYLSAANEKNDVTGTGVTAEGKTQLAEEAIRQFANLAASAPDNSNTITLARSSANDIAQSLSAHIGSDLVNKGKAEPLMEAVKTLSPKGWFGAKTPPTQDQFVKTVTDKTKNPLDASIARAIYAVFNRYVNVDGGSPESAVNSLLYSTSSTADRATPSTLTPQQFAQNIGNVYALGIVSQYFQ